MDSFDSHPRYSMPVEMHDWNYDERLWLGSHPEQSMPDENQGWNTN